MARLTTRRAWDKRISIDEPVKMDEGNIIHQAVKAQIIRAIRNDDYENMGNLQKVANMVTIPDANKTPVKVGTQTVTKLTDANGKVHTIKGDPATVQTYLNAGMKISSTHTEDIFDQQLQLTRVSGGEAVSCPPFSHLIIYYLVLFVYFKEQ